MFYEVTADIMARLPEKLQNLVEFGAIGDAVNPEIDKLNASIGLMAANAFIDTVDNEGLKRWEKILGGTSPLTVYKQRIINDPYHFEVANEKDYVKEASISGNTIQNGTPTPEAPVTPVCLPAGTEIKVVGKNEFDGVSTLNAFFASPAFTITALGTGKLAYCRCLPNTVYTISKTAGQRFVVGYVSQFPSVGLVVSGAISNFTASSITITTGSDAKYLVSYVYNSANDIISAEEMLASVQIEKGSVATTREDYILHTTLTTPCDLLARPDKVADIWNVLTGKVTAKIGKFIALSSITPAAVALIAGSPSFVRVQYSSAQISNYLASQLNQGFCSHFPMVSTATGLGCYIGASLTFNIADGTISGMSTSNSNDTNRAVWAAFLSAQETASTPLTVWYQLATPIETQHTPQPITLPQGTVNMVVESSNGVLPSAIDITLAEYQADETFQARKNAIKSKLMTKPPINLETLRTIIEAYMGVEVEITIADSVVSVVYRGDTEVVDLAPLYATLYETIPANLLVEIAYKYLQWLELDAQLLDFDALDALGMDWDEFERGDWIG